MVLPTFLGIGVPRAGTTWLAALLDAHPEVYMAPGKEIFFFDRYYHRGLAWYQKLFPPDSEAARYQAIGEFSPEYLFCDLCPDRISRVPSVTRLILAVRNPIDRAYSHYGLHLRSSTADLSFEAFLTREIIELGFYSQKIKNFLTYFHEEQLLILVFEKSIAGNDPAPKGRLARFLGVAGEQFPPAAGALGINRSYLPKTRVGYSLYVRMIQKLLKWGWHKPVKGIRRLRLQRFFGEAGPLPPMKNETRDYLRAVYKQEIREMEAILQEDLSFWS